MKLLHISVARFTTLALLVGFAGPVTGQPVASKTTPASATATAPIPLSSGAQDILKLSRAKVNDEVTVAFIRNGDRRFDLTASEVVYLRQEGVSDRVLATMLDHQPEMPAPTPAARSASASSSALVASAPQYVADPTTTAVVETTPSTTVYVGATTPTYYSFYDPSPYWYDPWPYYWGWSYPYFSFGWNWGGWGGCNYGYYRYHGSWDNDYCDNNGNDSNNGNPPPSDGNSTRVPPTREGTASGQSAAVASSERPTAGMNQTSSTGGSRTSATPSARTTPAGRSASGAGNNGTPPARVGTATAAAAPGMQTQGGERSAPANRTVAARTNPSQSGTAAPMRSQTARPTSTWSGGVSQSSVARQPASQGAVAVAPSRRMTTAPTTWSQGSGQPVNRYVATRPATSYQRGSGSPSVNPRAGASVASISRPSMTAPARSMGNSGAFRSGGSSAGGASRPMASSGGSRGGGGGGGGGRPR